jgi:pimeloyl-ACP methyl ester carboxylesterase
MQTQIIGHDVFCTTNGHGRPMLLMHGGSGLDHTYFRPWLDILSNQVPLIYYDQLGQGRSTRPQSYEGISMGTWADEADALRVFLGFDRIILLGHSFGGFIAQEYALRFGRQFCLCISIRTFQKWVQKWMRQHSTVQEALTREWACACPLSIF